MQKWTALIDLFSKDFIVVPVNQSLHWSLVIACHLGEAERLLDDSAVMDADADVIDVRSSAPPRAPCADASCCEEGANSRHPAPQLDVWWARSCATTLHALSLALQARTRTWRT